jgi:hypothetical protein
VYIFFLFNKTLILPGHFLSAKRILCPTNDSPDLFEPVEEFPLSKHYFRIGHETRSG